MLSDVCSVLYYPLQDDIRSLLSDCKCQGQVNLVACVLFWTHACYLADGSFHVIIKKVNIYEAMVVMSIAKA